VVAGLGGGRPRPPYPALGPSQPGSGYLWSTLAKARLRAARGAASWGGQAGGRHHFVFYLCVYQNQSLQMRRCDAGLAARCRSCRSSPPGTARRIDTKKCQKKSKLAASSVGQGRSDNPGSEGTVAGEVRGAPAPAFPPQHTARILRKENLWTQVNICQRVNIGFVDWWTLVLAPSHSECLE